MDKVVVTSIGNSLYEAIKHPEMKIMKLITEKESLDYTYAILKKLHKQYNEKAFRLLKTVSKAKNKVPVVYGRAIAWQQAALIIAEEMEAVNWRIKKTQ